MRQIILAFACLLLAWNVQSQNTIYTFTNGAGNGDFDTAGNWDKNAVPSKISDEAVIAMGVSVILKTQKTLFSLTISSTDASLNCSANVTAHMVDVSSGKIAFLTGAYLVPYNASSLCQVSSGGSVDVYGVIETSVELSNGVINVYVGGIVQTITYYGKVNIWGHVEIIAFTTSGGFVNVYAAASVTTVDPYGGELHIWPGSNIETISPSSSSEVYFEATKGAAHNVNNVVCQKSGYTTFTIANDTTVNVVKSWDCSDTSYTTTFDGWTGAILNIAKSAKVTWANIDVKNLVQIINNGILTITDPGDSTTFALNDFSSVVNYGTIIPNGGIRLYDGTSSFVNEQTGIIQTAEETNYECSFSGYYSPYPTIVNNGVINCAHFYANQLSIDSLGNLTSNNIELNGKDYPLVFKKGAIIDYTLNIGGSGGTIIFEDSHVIPAFNLFASTTYIQAFGNITIQFFNASTGTSYWSNFADSNGYPTNYRFSGSVFTEGSSYCYFENAVAYYDGTVTGGVSSLYLLNSTVTYTDKSVTDSTSETIYVNENSFLFLQGIFKKHGSSSWYMNTLTSIIVNQGKIYCIDSGLYTYYSGTTEWGTFYNVGYIESSDSTNTFYTDFGLCKSGEFHLVDTSDDSYFDGRIYLYKIFAAEGYITIEVPNGWQSDYWDGKSIISYSGKIQDWDFSDTKVIYKRPSDILGSTVNLCKTSSTISAYKDLTGVTCDAAPIIDPDVSICKPSGFSLPDATSPGGGGNPTVSGPSGTPTATGPTGNPTTTNPTTTNPTTTNPTTTTPPSKTNPTTTNPTTTTPPPKAPGSSAGNLRFSAILTLIVSFCLFRMF